MEAPMGPCEVLLYGVVAALLEPGDDGLTSGCISYWEARDTEQLNCWLLYRMVLLGGAYYKAGPSYLGHPNRGTNLED